MAKAKAKVKKKRTRRNRVSTFSSDVVAQLHRPFTHEATQALAGKLVQFKEDLSSWRNDCRVARKEGNQCPDFPADKIPDINEGRMSLEERQIQIEDYNATIEKGDIPGSIPICGGYHPIERELLNLLKCPVVRSGRAKNQPEKWDEQKFGPWSEGTVISGDILPLCHAKIVTRQVDNPKSNVLAFGKYRYIVGTGGHDGSAVFLIFSHADGIRGDVDGTRKRMALSGAKGLSNLVFRIEDAVTEIPVGDDVVTFMPGQVLTAGYLYNDEKKVLNPAQIRKCDGKGLRFRKLSEPIYGTVSWESQLAEIRKIEGKEFDEEKTLQNAEATCRVNPGQLQPFGFRSVALNMVPYRIKDVDGNMSWGVVVGERSNVNYTITKHDAKREFREADVVVAAFTPIKPIEAEKSVEIVEIVEPVEVIDSVEVIEKVNVVNSEIDEFIPKEDNSDLKELLSDPSLEVDAISSVDEE